MADEPNSGESNAALSMHRAGKRRCLKNSFLCAGISGLLIPMCSWNYAAMLSYVMMGYLTLQYAIWFRFDFDEKRYPTGRYGFLILIAFGTFTIPWYLYRTRGKRAILTIAKMLGVYLAIFTVMILGALLGEGIMVVVSDFRA